MSSNLDKFQADLEKLVALGEDMLTDLHLREDLRDSALTKAEKIKAKSVEGLFDREYQNWFTESSAVVQLLMPHRYQEFIELYKGNGKRKEIDGTTFNIQDWTIGQRASLNHYNQKRFNDYAAVLMRLQLQTYILAAVRGKFKSSLYDIRQVMQADLFDSELAAAGELLKHKFFRASGTLVGVTLERHLCLVCTNHNTMPNKKNPTISDFNDALKAAEVVDTPDWRFIQRMGDLRNLCAHNKEREPTADDVAELKNGVEKLLKTLF